AAKLRAACAGAPSRRGWARKVVEWVGDFGAGAGQGVIDLLVGVSSPVWVPVVSVYQLATGELTWGELEAKVGLAGQQVGDLGRAVWDSPGSTLLEVGKGAVSWDEFKDHSGRAAGGLVPDAVAAAATGGGAGVSRAVLRRLARGGDELAAVAGAVERLTPEEIAKLPRTDKGLIDSKHLPSEIKEALRGVDRGDKRDIFGKYVQKNDQAQRTVDTEARGFTEFLQVLEDDGVRVVEKVEDKLRATVSREGMPPEVAKDIGKWRYFDRIVQLEDGTWVGVEIKSGEARRSLAQRTFDAYVSPEHPARVKLRDGRVIEVTKVELQKVAHND
ncbi:hypothetical protein, partial [Buchananella hordeovulneris]|uniref:hypothetical protein n=1 Tax=Buchananella hordeovulneris TaxID=52770 RepID=UPI0026DC9641